MAKKESSFSKPELENIRQSLPVSWADDLSKKHGLSARTVKNIMYGTQANDGVVFSALDLAIEHKRFIESQKALVDTL